MRDDTKLPTIGIISPSFNQGAFIGAMLSSIESQTLQPAEHILLDPGSKDNSREQILAYAQRNKFARAVLEPDKGQVDAINRGLKASTADVLTWLNTDDLYTDPDALRAVAETFAAEPDVDVVYGRGTFVDANGKFLRDAYTNRRPEMFPETIKHSIGILQPALFFRREALEKAGMLDERWNLSLDYELWIRFIKAGLRFRFLDRSIVKAVLHDASKTGGQRGDQYDEIEKLIAEHFGFVPLRWLERHAEYLVEGKDGIISSAGEGKDVQAIEREIHRLQKQWNTPAQAMQAIEQHKDEPEVMRTLADLCRRGLVPAKRVVVTGFTSSYERQGLNLIASLHRHAKGDFDRLLVYSVDLSESQRRRLGALEGVVVLDFPPQCAGFYEDYLAPKNYGYKCAAIWEAQQSVVDGGTVLWMDAGVAPLRSIEEIFGIIERDGTFFIDHDDKPGWPLYNSMFIHPQAAKAMDATGKELLAPHLCSCMLGYVKNGSGQKLIDEAYRYSQQREVVVHTKHPTEPERRTAGAMQPGQREQFSKLISKPDQATAEQVLAVSPYLGHRQDQTIYSMLCARYGCLQHSATRYCWSGDESSRASLANWKSGAEAELKRSRQLPESTPLNTLTYHHRGLYDSLEGLPWRKSGQTLVVMGNGPSLRGFDFDRLDGIDSLGMNAAYRHWDRIGRYPTYYACMDTVVIRSHATEIDRLVRERRTNGIRLFFLRKDILEQCPHLANEPSVLFFEDFREASNLLDTGMITTGSLSALFGGFLGYRRVALLGIDCNYVEKLPQAESAGGHQLVIADTPKANPNYYFDDYQQKGDLYNIPNVHPGFHERSWKIAHASLEASGIQLINCNPESKLNTIPRMEFDEAVRTQVPPQAGSGVVGASFERCAKARIEELDYIGAVLGTAHVDDLMVDVGTHHGGSLKPFLDRGWKVLGFEPDPANREILTQRVGQHPRLVVDPRAVSNKPATGVALYSTDESSGASSLSAFTSKHEQAATVEVTTLSDAFERHGVERVRLLKVDAEGFDKMVLESLPWDRLKPDAIMVEFEDRKTVPLGYTTADMAQVMVDHGYTVFCSEWHPIVRYGIQHDWRRMFHWGTHEPDPTSWGNLIAFRYRADAAVFETLLREAVRRGELTGKSRASVASRPAQGNPLPEKPQIPGATPSNQTQDLSDYVLRIRELQQHAHHASVTQPAPLPPSPLVYGAMPWAPRQIGQVTLARHLMLSLGKVARIYFGRAGILALATVACWGAGVGSLANGQPLWVGLALAGSAFIPLFALIALLSITSRRQSFENCEVLRAATERAIRAAAEHQRGQQMAASGYTNALVARAATLLEMQEGRRFASRMDLQRLIDRLKSDTGKVTTSLQEQFKSTRQLMQTAEAGQKETRSDISKLKVSSEQVAAAARDAGKRADTARTDATAALRGQEATMKAVGELAKEATVGVRRASEAAQSASELVVVNKRATDQALTEAATRLGARIDESSTMLSRLRGDAYTQFSRVLTPALEQGALELGLKLKPGEFRYLERKLQVIEGLCEGRLAGSVDDAVARTLAARTWTGQEVRVLEIGVLFGVGAIFMHQTLQPFFERVQLTLLDPFDGYYGPSHLDPLTGQRVTRSMVERNLRRCSIPAEDCAIIDKFSTDPVALQAAKAQGPFAVVIIDGDHSREGVQADYELYADLVAPGGILIVDDYGSKDWPAVTAYTREVIEEDARFKRISVLGKTAVFRRAVAVKAAQARSTEPKPKKNDKVRQAEAVANTTDDALPFSD